MLGRVATVDFLQVSDMAGSMDRMMASSEKNLVAMMVLAKWSHYPSESAENATTENVTTVSEVVVAFKTASVPLAVTSFAEHVACTHCDGVGGKRVSVAPREAVRILLSRTYIGLSGRGVAITWQ